MNLDEVFKKRRSIRHYLDKPVPREIIHKLIEATQLAPNSCNMQLVRYIVIDHGELLRELRKKVSYKFAYSPCAILVVSDSRITVERKSAVMSAGMAVENLLLKAVDLGLSALP